MKSALIIVLIVSFIGVAFFGFLSMTFRHMQNGGCITSNHFNAPCPLNNIFSFIVFHLNAFKYLSTAVLSVVLLVTLIGVFFSVLPRPLNNDDEDELVFSFVIKESSQNLKNNKFIRWLSLRENSPVFNAKRMM